MVYRKCGACGEEFLLYDEEDVLCDDCLNIVVNEEDNLVECYDCGEWYDPDEYSECPYCLAVDYEDD